MAAASSTIRVGIGGGHVIELDGTAKKCPRVQDIVASLPRASRTAVELDAKYTTYASCTESYSSQKRGNFFEALGDKLSYEGITDKDALPSVFYQGKIKAQTCDQSDGVRANETGRGDRFWLLALPGCPDKPIVPIHIEADETVEKKNGRYTKTVEVISVDKMQEVRHAYIARNIAYLECDTKSTRLTVVERSAGSLYSVQYRDLGDRLQYCNFFDLFLELPGKSWTGLLSIDTMLDVDRAGKTKGKGGDESNTWTSIEGKEKPYLSAGSLILIADPRTVGDHNAMVASLIDQLNFMCVRPGTFFDMPDAAQAVALLNASDASDDA